MGRLAFQHAGWLGRIQDWGWLNGDDCRPKGHACRAMRKCLVDCVTLQRTSSERTNAERSFACHRSSFASLPVRSSMTFSQPITTDYVDKIPLPSTALVLVGLR